MDSNHQGRTKRGTYLFRIAVSPAKVVAVCDAIAESIRCSLKKTMPQLVEIFPGVCK